MRAINQAPPHRVNGRGHGTEGSSFSALGTLTDQVACLSRQDVPFGPNREDA